MPIQTFLHRVQMIQKLPISEYLEENTPIVNVSLVPSMFPAKKRLKVWFVYIPLPIFLSSMNVPLLLRSLISNAPSEFFLMTNWSLLSWWRDFFGSWSSPMTTSLSVALPTRMNPAGVSSHIALVNSTLRKEFCKEKRMAHWNRDKTKSIVVLTNIEAKSYTNKSNHRKKNRQIPRVSQYKVQSVCKYFFPIS